MIVTGSAELARRTRHERTLPNGFSFHRSEWMDCGRDRAGSPTVFLVEQPAGSILAPHFHTENQFQVIIAGSGTLGRHAVAAGSVHYAGAYTGYGPITAGPQGLSYFTIRSVYEIGAHFIASDRDKMKPGPKSQMQSSPVPIASIDELAALSGVRRVDLIEKKESGLHAACWYLPAGTVQPIDAPAASGQFQLVLAGTVVHDGALLQPRETRYSSADERDLEIAAGPQGAQVLVLQMPARDAQYDR